MAIAIHLSAKEQKELGKRKKNERDGKILRRLLCIEMKNMGEENERIAKLCGVCRDTITDWLRLFSEGSFQALCNLQYAGRRISVLEPMKAMLQAGIDTGKYQKLSDIKKELKENGIEVCESWIWKYLKKNSLLRLKRPN